MSSSFDASNSLAPSLSAPYPRRLNQHTRPSSVKCQLPSSDDHNSSNSNSNSNSNLFKTLSVAAAVSSAAYAVLVTDSLHFLLPDSSGGNAGGGGGGAASGGGGGGWYNNNGGGSFWSRILSSSARDIADESKSQDRESQEPPMMHSKLSGFEKFKISDIAFFDRNTKTKIGTEDSLLEMVSLRPGGVYTGAQLQNELETLASCGMFEKVDMEGKTNADGSLSLTIAFVESMWEQADRFRCIHVGLTGGQSKPIEMIMNPDKAKLLEFHRRRRQRDYKRRIDSSRPCLLASSVHKEISDMLVHQGNVTPRLLQRIRNRVEKWYHDEGYACARVINFGNLNTREVVCEIVEGDITQLSVQFLDKLGNVVEGNTQLPVVRRELPKQFLPGHAFNTEVGKHALRNIKSLALFSNIEVNPRPDENNEGSIIVEIKLKELDRRLHKLGFLWSVVPGQGGRPSLASPVPGGTITIERRNLQGLNRSITGSATTGNFSNPLTDLTFKLEYAHPFLDGVDNPRNRTLHLSCFKSRNLSPVFTEGAGSAEVPPIWVDRTGVKTNITENFTCQGKFTYGLVMEKITTLDKTNHICAKRQRVFPDGVIVEDGPPTTLSGTGIDRKTSFQANITFDNTRCVNGTIVGSRNVFQVDQGIGLGSNFAFFNRHQLTATWFLQLKSVEEGAGKPPPPVLVLHGHYGGYVGDIQSYDAFNLGGLYSVRDYSMGEIGPARNILELAAEVRVPVKGTHVYAYAEHGNDLGNSKDLNRNPTEVYGRMGHGFCYGIGVNLGLVRAEYAVNHNSGIGSVFVRYGERF